MRFLEQSESGKMWLFVLYLQVFQHYYSPPSSFHFALLRFFFNKKKSCHLQYHQTEYAGLFKKIEYRAFIK